MSETVLSTASLEAAPGVNENPANPPAKRITEATRVPMSLPLLKLQVPPMPGYHLHWFVTKNVRAAQRAGYEFVTAEEVDVNNIGLADDASVSGNMDMGTQISVLAGGLIEGTTQSDQLHLMKLRQEWRDKDVAALEAVNESIASAIRGGQTTPGGDGKGPQENPGDRARRYIKTGQDLFYPKKRP